MTSGAKAGDAPFIGQGETTAKNEAAGSSTGAEAPGAKSPELMLSWDERAPKTSTTPDTSKQENRSKIIVAVDDDVENLTIIGKIADFAGYTFFAVSNGEECVSLAMRVAPRLIFLDVQMPGLNGYETCRLLRNNHNLASIPIVFLTARKTREDVKKSMEVGGNDFIIKPFDAAKLRERMQYWANRHVRARFIRR